MPREFFTLSQFAQAMTTATGRTVPESYLRDMLCDMGIIEDGCTPSFFFTEVCGLCSREGLYSRRLIHDIYDSYFKPWCFYGDPPGGDPLESLTL